MAHVHVSYGPGLICHRVASVGGKTGTKRRRTSPIQKTGRTAHLRPRALTLSIDYFSPEIYGKGSEPGRFAEFAQFRQCELGFGRNAARGLYNLLQSLGAPLSDRKKERAAIYLTNAW